MSQLLSLEQLASVDEWLGYSVVVTGPMRAEKTRATRDLAHRVSHFAGKAVISFTPSNDERIVDDYALIRGWVYLSSQSDAVPSEQVISYIFRNPEDILRILEEHDSELIQNSETDDYVKLVDIQELSFLGADIIPVLQEIPRFNGRKRILVVSGLNKNFRGEAMGVMGWTMANFDKTFSYTAHCNFVEDGKICGKPAHYTYRLINIEKSRYDGPEVQVKNNGQIIRGFTFAPFFDPEYAPEKGKGIPEQDYERIYGPACKIHFPDKLPFQDETFEVHNYIIDHISEIGNQQLGSLHEAVIRSRFSHISQLEPIINFLVEERGVKREGGFFKLKSYHKGIRPGTYARLCQDTNFEMVSQR